mgnify:CR=1 FL=1
MTNPLSKPKTCQGPNCENDLSGKRSDAIYCSAACKLNAYHDRRGITTKRKRDNSMCQRESCGRSIPENLRADSKYCSNACRQKVWNDTHKDREKRKRDAIAAKKKEEKRKKEEAIEVEKFIQELMGE